MVKMAGRAFAVGCTWHQSCPFTSSFQGCLFLWSCWIFFSIAGKGMPTSPIAAAESQFRSTPSNPDGDDETAMATAIEAQLP